MWRERGECDAVVHRGTTARVTTRLSFNVFYPLKLALVAPASWVVDDVLVAGRSVMNPGRGVRGDEFRMDAIPQIALPVGADFCADLTYVGHEPGGAKVVAAVLGAMSNVYCVYEHGGTRVVPPLGMTWESLPYE